MIEEGLQHHEAVAFFALHTTLLPFFRYEYKCSTQHEPGCPFQ